MSYWFNRMLSYLFNRDGWGMMRSSQTCRRFQDFNIENKIQHNRRNRGQEYDMIRSQIMIYPPKSLFPAKWIHFSTLWTPINGVFDLLQLLAWQNTDNFRSCINLCRWSLACEHLRERKFFTLKGQDFNSAIFLMGNFEQIA